MSTNQPEAAVAPATATSMTTNIALVASFAALTAVCSIVAVPLSAGSTPITLQTFAVILAGAVLGARRGALAILLYMAVGFAGLPVFAQGFGGPAMFGRPSLGYLLAFPVAAFLIGFLVERFRARSWVLSTGLIIGAGVAGSLVIYAVGVPVMAAMTSMSFPQAFVFNLAFVPFDAIKLVLAAIVAASIHRAFPDLLPRRREPDAA
ncbi:MAG: biotin transporter BioY [Actinomycetales bacterium]|nr:biotin transporter BioY [Actinomycetales bacterium]